MPLSGGSETAGVFVVFTQKGVGALEYISGVTVNSAEPGSRCALFVKGSR